MPEVASNSYVLGKLRRIARENPNFTFQRVAERLYLDIPYDQLGRVLLYSSREASFDCLRETLIKRPVLQVSEVIKAAAIDLFYIYAQGDEELKTLIRLDQADRMLLEVESLQPSSDPST